MHEYSGANYLGLWHKHPLSHRGPSQADVLNAMDEIADQRIGLEELLTPICLLHPSRVEIVPYVVHHSQTQKIQWSQIPHDSITTDALPSRQWYQTKGGNDRLISEINGLTEMGMEFEVRKGPDEIYQIRVQVEKNGDAITEMVFLCPDDYPVGAPSVAILDNSFSQYSPFRSKTVNEWNISKRLRDVLAEYYADEKHDRDS